MELKNEKDLSEEKTSRYPSILVSGCFDSIKYDSVEDIIQKYKHKNRYSDQYSNPNLYRNVGNHALLPTDIRNQNSLQNTSFLCNNGEEQLSNNVVTYNCETNKHYVNKFTCSGPKLTSNEKVYHDKMTYCRPVLNYYNEQFLYKTMERNAMLKKLVKKLAIARQREKETVSWNNFINDLNTKHGLNFESQNINQNITINNEPDEYITPEIIDDYYNTRFSCVKSKPCRRLLQDFYGAYDESQSNLIYDRHNGNIFRIPERNTYLPHDRDSYCYPTSSQGRLIMERRKKEKESLNPWLNNINRGNSYKILARKGMAIDNEGNVGIHKKMGTMSTNCNYNNSATQTDVHSYHDFIHNINQDKATNTTNLDEVLINKNLSNSQDIKKSSNSLKQISLTSIDNKLEILIESLNIFIEEIRLNKANRRKNKCSLLKCQACNKDEQVGTMEIINVRKDTKGINYTNDIPEETADLSLSKLQSSSKIDKTFKGLDVFISKSLQIHDKYRNQPGSVQIDFEIPTKDTSTEVSKSLSKQDLKDKDEIVEEIYLSDNIPLQRMTIAVNTDPLSLLGLIRISTDTLKHLLSYMPNIDYYSYLSLLQFPQVRKVESHYVCNICGADYNKPSQLSDHIRSHDLGKTRDCCVCRHVLDLARKYPGLFRCQYCGQLFTRAYCCELHQESCAKRFGKHHDIRSSLVLLK